MRGSGDQGHNPVELKGLLRWKIPAWTAQALHSATLARIARFGLSTFARLADNALCHWAFKLMAFAAIRSV